MVVHGTFRRAILLQTVQVEGVAALSEGNTCFVLRVEHVVELEVLHHEMVSCDVRLFFIKVVLGNKAAGCVRDRVVQ